MLFFYNRDLYMFVKGIEIVFMIYKNIIEFILESRGRDY